MKNNNASQNFSKPTENQIQKIIELQISRVQNEAKELVLKEKELELNASLAHKSLEYQAKIEGNRHEENRKSFTRIGYVIGGLLILCMFFIITCLYLNKEEFLLSLIKYFGYVVTTGIGYYAGKKSNNKQDPNNSRYDEIEVVDN